MQLCLNKASSKRDRAIALNIIALGDDDANGQNVIYSEIYV
jgi:hypothetical protein